MTVHPQARLPLDAIEATHHCTLARPHLLLLLAATSTRAMRLVLQRVKRASVTVDEEVVGEIGKGMLVLVGIHRDDIAEDAAWCRERILKTNFWADENGRPWKHSVASLKLDVLCVSQFTFYGELKRKKGRGNLDWRHAMGPEPAKAFYETFLSDLRRDLPESSKLADGRFGAMMDVSLINDGPVTLSLDSRDGNGLAPVVPPSDDATV